VDVQTETRKLAALRSGLVSTYSGRLDASAVESVVDAAVDRYRDARVRDYVPVLVTRQVRAELGPPGRMPA
jgi:hypothetical protein